MATEYDVLRSVLVRAEKDDDRIARQFDKNLKRRRLLSLLHVLVRSAATHLCAMGNLTPKKPGRSEMRSR